MIGDVSVTDVLMKYSCKSNHEGYIWNCIGNRADGFNLSKLFRLSSEKLKNRYDFYQIFNGKTYKYV